MFVQGHKAVGVTPVTPDSTMSVTVNVGLLMNCEQSDDFKIISFINIEQILHKRSVNSFLAIQSTSFYYNACRRCRSEISRLNSMFFPFIEKYF